MNRPTHYTVRDLRIEPAVVLAPMENVTDVAFRRMIRRAGEVGLTYTEFIASSGLSRRKSGRGWVAATWDPDERPVAAQIFGRDPQAMADAARLLEDAGATLIDINMGCPSKRVCKNSGGSALMADPAAAVEIVRAVKGAIRVPLTVKMRSGFDAQRRNAADLAHALQEEGAEGITIHWRTREDGYKGQRRVDAIAEAVHRVRVPVIANGDIVDVDSAQAMLDDTGCAGLMVGRGAIADPWLCDRLARWLRGEAAKRIDAVERRRVLLGYTQDLVATMRRANGAMGRIKMAARRFAPGLPGGEQVKEDVTAARTVDEAVAVLERWLDGLVAAEAATPPACEAWQTAAGSSSAAPSSGWTPVSPP